MFGFFIGAACLFGLFAMRRRTWGRSRACMGPGYGHGYGGRQGPWAWRGPQPHDYGQGNGPGSWGAAEPEHGPGRPQWLSRRFVRWLSTRLDATPEQHHTLVDEFEQFFDKAQSLRPEGKLSRIDLSAALRADSFDAETMGEAFARQDDKLRELREALVGALARIHDALDEGQRQRLAEIVEHGPRGFGRRWH